MDKCDKSKIKPGRAKSGGSHTLEYRGDVYELKKDRVVGITIHEMDSWHDPNKRTSGVDVWLEGMVQAVETFGGCITAVVDEGDGPELGSREDLEAVLSGILARSNAQEMADAVSGDQVDAWTTLVRSQHAAIQEARNDLSVWNAKFAECLTMLNIAPGPAAGGAMEIELRRRLDERAKYRKEADGGPDVEKVAILTGRSARGLVQDILRVWVEGLGDVDSMDVSSVGQAVEDSLTLKK